MIKYRVQFNHIEMVEVVRETEKQVVLSRGKNREIRESKITDWRTYHDTWDAAHQYLIDVAQSDVFAKQSGLNAAINRLDIIRGMKP